MDFELQNSILKEGLFYRTQSRSYNTVKNAANYSQSTLGIKIGYGFTFCKSFDLDITY